MSGTDIHGRGRTDPREGSTLYYALLWTSPGVRARLLDRLALIEELATTLDDVQDPGVAEKKVHWWHEEIARLADGAPRHPRAVACTASLAGHGDATNALLDILSVTATTRYTPAPDDDTRRERLVRDHGARLALLAHASSDDPADLAAPSIRHPSLAAGLGMHDALARLPSLLHRGFAVFSEAGYASRGLTPAALARHVRRADASDTDGASATGGDGRAQGGAGAIGTSLGGIPVVSADPDRHGIVADEVAAAHAALEAALGDPAYHDVYSRAALAPLARLAALRARELRTWREAAPDLLRERVTPTPLAKFLVAWRHRHGARRPRLH